MLDEATNAVFVEMQKRKLFPSYQNRALAAGEPNENDMPQNKIHNWS
jgi:hypothetical protein